MPKRLGSVNPLNFPDEVFDLYSIPAFDKGRHEIVTGSEIGSTKQIVQPNDVLLSKIVPHIRRAWVVDKADGRRMIASGEWIVFRRDDFSPKFLKHYLTNDMFHSRFMQTVSGVGGSLLRARPASVANIPIPLPPLPEQIRIADVLSRAEKLIAQRKESLALLDELVQSRFVEMFGDPVRNEKGWPAQDVTELCDEIVDCVNKTAPEAPEKTPYVMIRTSNIKAGKIRYDNIKYVTEATYKIWTRRSIPQIGDILFTREAPMGEAAKVETETKIFLGQRIMQYRCNRSKLNPDYLLQLMSTAFFKKQIDRLGKGSTVKHLTVPDCFKFQILCPPLPLQNDFAAFVEKTEALKRHYQQSLDELENLYGSLSQRAFAGELTRASKENNEGSGQISQEDQAQKKPISEMTLDEYLGVPEEITAEHGYLDRNQVDYEFLIKKYFSKRPIEAKTFEELFNREYYDAGHSFDYGEFRKTIIENLENPNGFLMQIYNDQEKKIEIRLK